MGHSHDHNHGGTRVGSSIGLALLLNVSFTVIEIVGGIWTNSLAILSDALHDLGDSISLGLAFVLERYSARPGDRRFSFGYRRFSLLGALINGIILIAGSFFILAEAVPRLLDPPTPHAPGMLGLAVLGVLVNGLAAWRLKTGGTLNERMVAWHLLEDVLGWIAVLLVGIILFFFDLPVLDPVLSILISAYVLYGVVRRFRETALIFLQGVPPAIDIPGLESELAELPGVRSVHNTHAWSLDGDAHVLTVHIVPRALGSIADLVALKARVKATLRKHPIQHATIEIEFDREDCYMAAGSETGAPHSRNSDHN